MKAIRIVLMIVSLALLAYSIVVQCYIRALRQQDAQQALLEPTPDPKATFSHMPASGHCVAGARPEPTMFLRDKRLLTGCYNPRGNGDIDYIMPGETFNILLALPAAPDNRPRI